MGAVDDTVFYEYFYEIGRHLLLFVPHHRLVKQTYDGVVFCIDHGVTDGLHVCSVDAHMSVCSHDLTKRVFEYKHAVGMHVHAVF